MRSTSNLLRTLPFVSPRSFVTVPYEATAKLCVLVFKTKIAPSNDSKSKEASVFSDHLRE